MRIKNEKHFKFQTHKTNFSVSGALLKILAQSISNFQRGAKELTGVILAQHSKQITPKNSEIKLQRNVSSFKITL